jgi:hypothetical protein
MGMSNPIAIVDRTVRAAGIPIDGVAIGTLADRATWRVKFQAAATAPQRTQAQTILDTVAIDVAALAAQDQIDAQAFIDGLPIWAKALVLALIDQLNVIRAALPSPLGAITPAQAIAAIRAKAGTL